MHEECVNEHWFTHQLHARTVIELWRCEYNEERPKKALGGMAPATYAKQLTAKADTIDPGLDPAATQSGERRTVTTTPISTVPA